MSASSTNMTSVESSPTITHITLTATGNVLCLHTSAVSSSMELAFGVDAIEASSNGTMSPFPLHRGRSLASTVSHTPPLDSPVFTFDAEAEEVRSRVLETLERTGAVCEIDERATMLGSHVPGKANPQALGSPNSNRAAPGAGEVYIPTMHGKRRFDPAGDSIALSREGRKRANTAHFNYYARGSCSSLVDTQDSVSARISAHLGERTLRDHAFLYWPAVPLDQREDAGLLNRKVSGAWRVVANKLGVRK